MLDNYFLIVPAVPGKCGGITLGHLPCWDFLSCRVGKRAGLLSSFFPTGRAYNRALESENPLYPPISIGGGGQWIQMTGA